MGCFLAAFPPIPYAALSWTRDMAIEPARVMAVRLPGLPIGIDMLAHCRSWAEADKILA